ncbi:MAG: RNA methyltransferase [Deltaproteobacteria bacterium]|nr:MAG: RNA methyltransferase [Deltaproteobacteria bacterium]RLB80539.1 MAG: RNA methyltransferase [Deltaproteobacteria bacterium]
MRLYLGLVHFPVYNKNRDTIASAVTTLDIHDISRLARTYGSKGFFVITPLKDQKRLVERIREHWTEGYGGLYNPDRKEALELVHLVDTVEYAREEITKIEGERPVLLATDASKGVGRTIGYKEARNLLEKNRPVCLCFGTAWGLHRSVLEAADYVLEPVYGPTEYNHLSVRAAASIIVDRLVGR